MMVAFILSPNLLDLKYCCRCYGKLGSGYIPRNLPSG